MFKVRYLKLYTRKTVSTSFHVKALSSHQFYGLNGSSLADIGHVVVTPTSTACFIPLPRYFLRPIKTSSIIFRLWDLFECNLSLYQPHLYLPHSTRLHACTRSRPQESGLSTTWCNKDFSTIKSTILFIRWENILYLARFQANKLYYYEPTMFL